MSKISSPKLGQFARTSIAAAVLVGLASLSGCGGGGGGESSATPAAAIIPPPPVALAVVNITAVGPTGEVATSTPVTVDATITSATSANLAVTAMCGTTSIPLSVSTMPAAGGRASAVPVSGSFPAGASCTATATLTATNAGGTTVPVSRTTSFTTPGAVVKYNFARLNLLVTDEIIRDTGNGTGAVGYPQYLENGRVAGHLSNETGFQVGLCALSLQLYPDGRPGAWCTKPSNGNVRAYFPIDPVRRVLMPEYVGSQPAGMDYYSAPYSNHGDSPYAAYGVSRLGKFIDVPGVGTYYIHDTEGNRVRLTPDTFRTSTVVHEGATMILLMTYSNPAP